MRDKYEREIEELLEKLDKSNQFMSREPRPPRGRRTRPGWFQSFVLNLRKQKVQLSPGWLMLASVGLMLLFFFVRPLSPGLAGPLGLLGALLFIAAYAYGFRRQRSLGIQPRWRGRIIELPRRNSWRYRLSRWLRKRL